MKSRPYVEAADLFQVLSHEMRLRILDELRKDEACVCHLQAVLDRPQAYVSQQLRVLRDKGMVQDRRDGTLVYYRLADSQVERLLEDMLGPAGARTCYNNCPCPHCEQTSGNVRPDDAECCSPDRASVVTDVEERPAA